MRVFVSSLFAGLALAGCTGNGGPTCNPGAVCTPDNGCHLGFTACGTGSPVCQDAQVDVGNGATCGAGSVCKDGVCGACPAGTACTPDANACHLGAIDCSSGAATCKDTGANAAAGADCGVNRFCAAGRCGDCTLGAVCTDGISTCHAGAIACDTGAPVCKDASNWAEGTNCANGAMIGYCKAGVCTPCAPPGSACGIGGSCTADGRCMLTVTGSARITYWPESGGSSDLGNCYGQQAEVFTPNGDGGYTQLAPTNGVCTVTNGSFTIPDLVPGGVYLLHFAGTLAYGNYYVETTQPTLDFGRDQAGRPDQNLVANTSTLVTFDSSGLEPWTPSSDTLEFACGNAGVALAVASSAFGLDDLAVGATTGTSVIDWKAQPLVDPTKGDAAWLYQLATRTAGATSYRSVTRAAKLGGFTVADGSPLTVAPALAVVSSSGSVQLTWATTSFEALAVKANPRYAVGAHYLSVDAVQVPASSARYTPASAHVPLLALSVQPGTADLELGALAYGRFLGAPWRDVVSTRFDMHADYRAAGATNAATSYIGIYQQDPLPLAGPLAPRLGPPLRPLVAGLDATLPQTGVTTTAELSWLAPSAGAPDFYAIAINEVSLDADGKSTDVATIANFLTASPRILVPPGVLVDGHAYFAVIAALKTPDVSYDSAPLRQGLSTVRAETGTAIFIP
jgi:hypothetical protein